MSRHSKASKERTVDPEAVYMTGLMYHKASGRLHRLTLSSLEEADGEADISFMVPAMMLSAFASEVYLKCLYGIANNGARTVHHDLHRLFHLLPEATRKLVEKHWDAEAATDGNFRIARANFPKFESALIPCLKESKEAFEAYRYVFEDKDRGFMIGILPKVLRLSILELKPGWASLKPRRNVGKLMPGGSMQSVIEDLG